MPDTLDPRLNCAAEICCQKPAADAALEAVLCDLGCSDADAAAYAQAMRKADLVFMPGKLARVIAEIADHPNRKDT